MTDFEIRRTQKSTVALLRELEYVNRLKVHWLMMSSSKILYDGKDFTVEPNFTTQQKKILAELDTYKQMLLERYNDLL